MILVFESNKNLEKRKRMKMKRLTLFLTAIPTACLLAATAHGQADMAGCSAIAAPAARLACYDALANHAAPQAPSATGPAPRPAPAARPVAHAFPARPTAAPSSYEALRKRSNFASVALEVEPLPHGLFRLHLADGTAYDTSMEGAHIAKGETLHIRRSPLGTTFVDLPAQQPIPVRLVRQE
jgi:hypothetical protein